MFQAQVIYSMKMPWGIEWSSNKVIAFCSMLLFFCFFLLLFSMARQYRTELNDSTDWSYRTFHNHYARAIQQPRCVYVEQHIQLNNLKAL